MGKKELYYFATDSLIRVAAEDPACVPLRLFFDQQAHVLTTQQCYDEAYALFAQHHIVERKAKISFSTYFSKVEIVNMDSGISEIRKMMDQHLLDEASASLIAAIKDYVLQSDDQKSIRYLVTSNARLILAAQKEGIDFHDYSEEQFCSKYGS